VPIENSVPLVIKTENALEKVAGDIRKLVPSKIIRVRKKSLATKQCAPSPEWQWENNFVLLKLKRN
jgi:hypothetical protein